MDRIEHIERYLRARLAAEQAGRSLVDVSRTKGFVTISRESGTGAHRLADTMLDVFSQHDDADTFGGWRIYDRTICEIVASDTRFAPSLDSLIEEEYRAGPQDFFHQIIHSTVDQGMIMDRVFLVVRAIAGMGKAIIIGRGGAQVTRGMPHGLSLRLVAPDETRIAQVSTRYEISDRDARAEVKRRDTARARMIRRHFGVEIDDPHQYDTTWNSGSASHLEIATAVCDVLAARSPRRNG